MTVSLAEVVAHYSKTAPPKRKLALEINDGPDTKKTKKKEESGTSDSESDSSSGEEAGLDNEVEISLCAERTELQLS